MITSILANSPTAVGVEVSEDELSVSLSEGRVVRVPLSWYPRLSNALPQHRAPWEFIGAGHGIHWPELDEDISVENVLLGQPSGESTRSFARWKEWYRQKVAEQGAAPNDGPAVRLANSGDSGGPPLVS
jgi:hypothetical protein